MNTAAKGRKNEWRSMAILEASGYICTRAAGSHGMWDIVGIGPTDVVLVQVKTGEWPRSVEMEALHNFVCPPFVRRLIHRWRPRKQVPDVKVLE